MTRFASMGVYGAGNTWGIPGPTFLLYYSIAAAVVVVVAVFLTVSALTGRRAESVGELDPEAAGYLAGGRPQAYYAAMTALRALGLITGNGSGRICATGQWGIAVSPLQQVILDVAASGTRTSTVLADPRVRVELDRLQDRLETAGLVRSRQQARALRLSKRLIVVLELIGVARVMAGIFIFRPFGNLLIVMVVLGVIGMLLRVLTSNRTAAGAATLRRLRAANDHLRGSSNPSWTTYGPYGAGLSVALFGATSMFAFDPVFAAEAAIPRSTGGGFGSDSGGGFGSGWGDGGSGGGDSGGGSSGGGDSGGGSSCGGGGCGG